MNNSNQPVIVTGASAVPALTPALALAQVRAFIPPDQSIAIHCDLWNHPGGLCAEGEPPVEVAFRIWDGFRHFEGKTLEEAVSACLAAYRPKAKRPLETASAFFSGAADTAALNQEAA